jgi:predicted lysophospholipase L1 biosynthesis ABC-type transport system permease subunit
VVISDGMARRFWPNEDPVGRRLKWGAPDAQNPWLTIIGVVGDVKQGPLDEATLPHTYETYSHLCQQPEALGMCQARVVLLRTSGDPNTVIGAARMAVHQIDPEQAIDRVVAIDQLISDSLAPRQLNTLVLVAFGLGALALAAIGVYGVISYTVSQQTRELGLRLALGAQPGDVMRLVLTRGLRPALIGLAIGFVASLGATRVMGTLLYGVSPTDPWTFAIVGALLTLIAVAACWLPARRAVHNDPVTTLRSQ